MTERQQENGREDVRNDRARGYARFVIKLEKGQPVEGLININSDAPFRDIFSGRSLARLSEAYLEGAIGYDEYRVREREINPVKFGDFIIKSSK